MIHLDGTLIASTTPRYQHHRGRRADARGRSTARAGREHFFEHWIERYRDATGRSRRKDQIVSGGGGAPLYAYRGKPDLCEYLVAGARDSMRVEHLVRPAMEPGDSAYHFLVVHMDGEQIWLGVVGVDWGSNFQP